MKKDKKNIYKGIKPKFKPAGNRTLKETIETIKEFQAELSKLKPEDIPQIFQPF